ncbi:MAG: hypothetical protein MI976_07245 [Pseudomonadales bacterium]|nr:hypothetical protein [Pseudomonadales bacterium]
MDEPFANRPVLLGFKIPEDDAGQMLLLLKQMHLTPHREGLSHEAAKMVSRLLDLGIQSFYFDVMGKIKAPANAQQTADKGIITVTKGAKLVINKMINALEPDELPIFASYMEQLFVQQSNDSWHLAFPLPQSLAANLETAKERILKDANTSNYNDFVADTLCQICDQAIIHFYSKPTQLFKIRPWVKRSTDLGIKTINRGLHFVIKQLFKKTRQKELIEFSELLESQLVYP